MNRTLRRLGLAAHRATLRPGLVPGARCCWLRGEGDVASCRQVSELGEQRLAIGCIASLDKASRFLEVKTTFKSSHQDKARPFGIWWKVRCRKPHSEDVLG